MIRTHTPEQLQVTQPLLLELQGLGITRLRLTYYEHRIDSSTPQGEPELTDRQELLLYKSLIKPLDLGDDECALEIDLVNQTMNCELWEYRRIWQVRATQSDHRLDGATLSTSEGDWEFSNMAD